MKSDLKHAYQAGFDNVFLTNGFERIEAPYGAGYRYTDSVTLDQQLCAALLKKPGRLNASEVLFLRLRVDWRQEDLAQRLHISPQTVSLWERGQVRLPAASDLLFRMRFMAEVSKRKRPDLRVKNLWALFDQLVRQVCDFDYVGYWDNGWTFAYERRATSFVAAQETLVEGLFENIDVAILGRGSANPLSLEPGRIATRFEEGTITRARGVIVVTQNALRLAAEKDAIVTVVADKTSPLTSKLRTHRIVAKFNKRSTSATKLEKVH